MKSNLFISDQLFYRICFLRTLCMYMYIYTSIHFIFRGYKCLLGCGWQQGQDFYQMFYTGKEVIHMYMFHFQYEYVYMNTIIIITSLSPSQLKSLSLSVYGLTQYIWQFKWAKPYGLINLIIKNMCFLKRLKDLEILLPYNPLIKQVYTCIYMYVNLRVCIYECMYVHAHTYV